MINHYEVLGVERRTRLAGIRKAYRRLARKYHPDLNPGDRRAEERFGRISEAYNVLSDPEKRRGHDRELERASAQAPGAETAPTWAGVPDPDAPLDFGDTGAAASMFSAFLSEIFGGREVDTEADCRPRRGADVTLTISLGFHDALRGVTTEVTIDAETPCPRCDASGRVPSRVRRPCADCAGTGRVSHASGLLRFATTCRRCAGEGVLAYEGCGHCRGTGVLHRDEALRVEIPAGVDSGSCVRVAGRGRAGRNSGPPGDLFVMTQVAAHPTFRRIGDSIHCAVPITVPEAALGARIEVPTISGWSSIRIPPGTENGQKFRLRGKGAPLLRGSGRGDQYVEVHIVTPRATDEKSRQLLRDLGTLHSGEDLRRGLLL